MPVCAPTIGPQVRLVLWNRGHGVLRLSSRRCLPRATQWSRRSAAEALVRERDQFLALAAHELKTPLASLGGYLELFTRRMQREDRLQAGDERSLQVIREQVTRLNHLVAVLLDLARLEHGQFDMEQRLVELGALVHRVVADLHPGLTQRVVAVHGSDEPLRVWGDELRLEQVIQNLVSNAIKYSPKDSVITVVVLRHRDRARVSVRDQGIGIPAEAQASIFQHFYGGTNVNPLQVSGLGIGLYVVKEIITRHGGTVALTSQEGFGSTFTVEIPLSSDDTKHLDQPGTSDVPVSHES